MAVVRYTAARSLTGGVTLGQTVTANLSLAALTRSRKANKISRSPIQRPGIRETIYYGYEIMWDAQSIPLTGSAALNLVMFLDSVESGAGFEFSPYQVVGDSITWRNVVLDSEGYTESRTRARGTGNGINDYFSYAFTMVEVP